MVPPMVRVTALFLVTPYRLAIGYDTNVCVENMLANSNEERNG
jgi:hypothetical protein